MMLRSSIILLITLTSTVFDAFFPGKPDEATKEFFTLQAVVKFMDRVHYAPRTIDDQLSKHVYQTYLESIDPSRRFLTERDLDQLEVFKTTIDDQISVGSLEFLDRSVDVINNSIERVEKYFSDIINMEVDLHAADSIILNADLRGYAGNDEELRSFWQQLVRYEIMLKVSDLKEAKMEEESQSESALIKEAKEQVKESFEGWFERLKGLRRSDRFEDYLNAITSAYDPHSNYFSPRDKESFDQEMYGTYEGIGARLIPEGELTKVTQIIPGGPAWKQKELEVNDFIIMVAQEGEEPKDVRGWRQDDVIDLIRGKKGTKVQLTVRKQDGSVAEIAIVRDQVILEEGNAKSLMLQLGDQGPEIGYILLPKFYFESGDKLGCADDVANEIKRLSDEGAHGLILDLRNNGGGSLSEVVKMSGLFFEKGPVVQVKSRDRKPYVLRDQDPHVQYDGPLIIMVNHLSASASEIIAAALQDYNRALIVGSNSTFGKGTVQRFEELDRFVVGQNELKPLGEVKITTQKFYRVNGGSTQLRGVIPDVILPMPYNHIRIGEKEFETPLEWSEIDAISFEPHAAIADKEALVRASQDRVMQSESFAVVEQRAQSLKEEEESARKYPLNIQAYEAMVQERELKNARFKDVFQPIEQLKARNPESVVAHIMEDETRKANNEDFIKEVKKDIYLEEALYIMQDMLQQQ